MSQEIKKSLQEIDDSLAVNLEKGLDFTVSCVILKA